MLGRSAAEAIDLAEPKPVTRTTALASIIAVPIETNNRTAFPIPIRPSPRGNKVAKVLLPSSRRVPGQSYRCEERCVSSKRTVFVAEWPFLGQQIRRTPLGSTLAVCERKGSMRTSPLRPEKVDRYTYTLSTRLSSQGPPKRAPLGCCTHAVCPQVLPVPLTCRLGQRTPTGRWETSFGSVRAGNP
jgi:hypothetical protein